METRRLLKGLALCAVLAVFTGGLAAGARANETRMAAVHPPLQCLDCHICSEPSAKDTCLRPRPRQWPDQATGAGMSSKAGPGLVRLDVLENLYEPVNFNHRTHAEMAEMSGGCVACHHFTPTGASHPPCRQCHATANNHGKLAKLGLKGAYHRQCLGCHREWSGQDQCEVCHRVKPTTEKHVAGVAAETPRPCREPDLRVYDTPSQAGRYVTFFHRNHAHYYGLACSDCHRQDPCVACHYQGARPVAVVQATADAMHHKCAACHDIQSKGSCAKCHGKAAKTAFSHGQTTGFDLSPFHAMLSCASCHPAGKRISRLSGTCNDCHGDWSSENFDHAVVGVELSEEHAENDCEDCHVDRRFDKPPSCKGCHDKKQYPRDVPGKRVGRLAKQKR